MARSSSRAVTALELLRVAIEFAAYTHERTIIEPALRVVALDKASGINAHSKLYLAREQGSLRTKILCNSADGGAAQWANWRTAAVSRLSSDET